MIFNILRNTSPYMFSYYNSFIIEYYIYLPINMAAQHPSCRNTFQKMSPRVNTIDISMASPWSAPQPSSKMTAPFSPYPHKSGGDSYVKLTPKIQIAYPTKEEPILWLGGKSHSCLNDSESPQTLNAEAPRAPLIRPFSLILGDGLCFLLF